MTDQDRRHAHLPFEEPGAGESIPARLDFVAQQLPDHPAVIERDGAITYGALHVRSGQLAAHLADRFGTGPEPVALLLPGMIWTVVGIFGVLRAGKFYVPLDPGMQPEVHQTVLQLSTARILLTTAALADRAEAVAAKDTEIVVLDRLPLGSLRTPPSPRLLSTDLASVAFSSGSTGQPKGVMWHHGGWLHRGWYANQHEHVGPQDRVASLRSPGFVAYASVMFGALLNGATLCDSALTEMGAEELFQWLNAQRITIFGASGMLHGLFSVSPQQRSLDTVREIRFAGQSVRWRDLMGLPDHLPAGCLLTNRLAMSELPTVANYIISNEDIKPSADLVPVGYACAGNEILIGDEQGRPLPPGEVGEIMVRSRHLSPGYWRDPEATAVKFLPDPDGGDRRILLTGDMGRMTPDGCLEYHGRKDLMVKIRGYRVEPQAIETALLAHPDVTDCVVVTRPGLDGQPRLMAYLMARQAPYPSVTELRQWVMKTLPAYMIPARFVFLADLPRNASGKLDRQALPAPGEARPQLDTPFVAPESELEQQLAGIWAEVLELDEVGVDDNFFELGGDSLSILNMRLLVEQASGWSVPVDFYRAPTIRQLTRLMGARVDVPEDGRAQTGAARHEIRMTADAPVTVTSRPGGSYRARFRQVVLHHGPAYRGHALPYAFGTHLQRVWLSQRVVQERVFAEHSRLFWRCLGDAGLEDPKREHLTRNLMVNTWTHWRRRSLVSPPNFSRWVATSGTDHLKTASRQQNGLILVFVHQVISVTLARIPLRDCGICEELVVTGGWPDFATKTALIRRTMSAQAGIEVLRRGGAVLIAGDGRSSTNPMSVPFYRNVCATRWQNA